MSGATSRRRGHNWERQLARTLSAVLDLDVSTARSVSGGYQAGVLQGFPADFPWQGSKTAKFRQIGNAIPPAMAAAAVSRMVETQEVAA